MLSTTCERKYRQKKCLFNGMFCRILTKSHCFTLGPQLLPMRSPMRQFMKIHKKDLANPRYHIVIHICNRKLTCHVAVRKQIMITTYI